MNLNLRLACTLYDRTIPLQNGSVTPEGIDLEYLSSTPSELWGSEPRYNEFDVVEFSLSRYCTLLAQGDQRLVAIPVFPLRSFRHSNIFINTGAGIREAKDLVGKRVGSLAYQQTAAVWIRGHLKDEYGVPPDQVNWYFGGYNDPGSSPDSVPVTLPANIRTHTIPNDKCLNQMLVDGEIDALIGSQPPRSIQEGLSSVGRLFPNYQEVEADYFQRTGIFPIMHTVLIRREVYEKAPWVAASLYNAFSRAKEMADRRLSQLGTIFCMLPWLGAHLDQRRAVMGNDPFVYGLEENRKGLEVFLGYCLDQGMVSRSLTPDELFVPVATSA